MTMNKLLHSIIIVITIIFNAGVPIIVMFNSVYRTKSTLFSFVTQQQHSMIINKLSSNIIDAKNIIKTKNILGTVNAFKIISTQSPYILQINVRRNNYHTSISIFGKPKCLQFQNKIQNDIDTILLRMLTLNDEQDNNNELIQQDQRIWDITGLKKEVDRLIVRTHKKIDKIQQRIYNNKLLIDRMNNNLNATLEDYENCLAEDIIPMEFELSQLQERLQSLNQLIISLTTSFNKNYNKNTTLPEDMEHLVLQLNVRDRSPTQPVRGGSGVGLTPKKKGPSSQGPRKPYRRYYSYDNIEIRVGKKAEDNDQLSLLSEYRHNNDWWMHASGCPGSHVVIQYQDEIIPNEVIYDAASLAARYSKCFRDSYNGTIKVSLTRCRDVKKPSIGAKPGLVMLTGKVKTITVQMKDAEKRLERLEKTLLMN